MTRPRLHRLRRFALALVGLLVALTLASVVGNALTRPPDTLAALDGSFVDVGGTHVHYLAWGSTGTPIVLVHGFAESGVSWTPTAERLARTHRVIAVDLIGSGYTDHGAHDGLDDQAALVDGLLHALHLQPAVLVGHSMGAAVVGAVALADPADVRGVVFLDGDGLAFNGSAAPAWARRIIAGSPFVTSGYRIATRWHWLDRTLVHHLCGSRCLGVTPDLVEAWMRPLRQGAAERALPRMAASGVLALTPDQERHIARPRGIVWGAEDGSGGGSRADVENYLGHPASITIAGAGHLSQVADPDAVARAITTLSLHW